MPLYEHFGTKVTSVHVFTVGTKVTIDFLIILVTVVVVRMVNFVTVVTLGVGIAWPITA